MSSLENRVRNLGIWQNLNSIEPLHGGVSNASFKVCDSAGSFVVRIGPDYPFHQVQRAREAQASRAAYASGLAPEVVYASGDIIALRFIDGTALGEADVRANMRRCLDLIAQCHRDMKRRVLGQGAIFWVFQILRDYAATLMAARHRRNASIEGWMAITNELEAAQAPLPVVFGHHDLLAANFIDDGKRLWLIDWEYAAFGTAMFDLANLSANNSFDDALDEDMLRTYFGGAHNRAIEKSFAAMKTASALREAMWAMVSELYLSAPGADYAAHAATYLERFEKLLTAYRKEFH